MTLEQLYQHRKSIPWNINEHLDTLRRYSSECDFVTEFGAHIGFSTIAFLAGQPKELHSWDVTRQPEIDLIEAVVPETRTKYVFHLQDSAEADFASTDLLFIDSLHQYSHVLQELQRHAHKVTKYLILHDTFAWAYIDERVSDSPTDINYGWAHQKGVAQALGHYLSSHPEWRIHEQFYHNCGLTIYRRET